jgi:hypothetical protein
VRKLKAVDMQEQIASKEFTNVKFADTWYPQLAMDFCVAVQ